MLGHMVTMFNLLRNCQTVFHSDCITLYSPQQQCVSSSFPHPPQHLFSFFWPHSQACRILVSQQVVKIAPPAVQSWSLNHWTAREVLFYCDHFSGYPAVSPYSFGLHFLRANKQNIFSCVCCCLVAKSCLTLCHPMDCSPPGSMEFSKQEYWSGLPFPSPGGSSQSRDRTWVSCISGRFFTV